MEVQQTRNQQMGRDWRRVIAAAIGMLVAAAFPLADAAAAVGDVITIAGTGMAGFSGDGGPAVAATLASPVGLALDSAGRLLIADERNHAIRRVAADGTIATVAGTGGVPGYAGDGGIGVAAQFDGPRDVAVRPNGGIYIADTGNHVIRSLVVGGSTSTIVGTGTPGFSGDGGPAGAAQLNQPSAIATRPSGVLVIADTGNDRIRMVGLDGVISTIAGTGAGDGSPATAVPLDDPRGVAVRANGTVYIADTGNHRVLKVDHVTGSVTRIAGTGAPGFSGDGGPATSARMRLPEGLSVASDGSILVADTGNDVIRRIDPTGTITTVAGTGRTVPDQQGDTRATSPLLSPRGVVEGVDGSVLLSDSDNNKIRQVRVVPDEPVFTGTAPDSPGDSLQPLLLGIADDNTTVRIYTDARCTGPALATGSAAEFSTPGLRVTVPADRTTEFHATATDGAGVTSRCSASSVTYVAKPPPRPDIAEPTTPSTPPTTPSTPPTTPSTPPTTTPPTDSAPQLPDAASPKTTTESTPHLARPATPVDLEEPLERGAPAPAVPAATHHAKAVAPTRRPAVDRVPHLRSVEDGMPRGAQERSPSAAVGAVGRGDARGARTGVLGIVTKAAGIVGDHADKAVLPGGLFAAMLAFLGVQNQIDRRDPKLALAPIQDEPDLEFPINPTTSQEAR